MFTWEHIFCFTKNPLRMGKKNFKRSTSQEAMSHLFLQYMEITVAGVAHRRENAVTLAEINSTGDV